MKKRGLVLLALLGAACLYYIAPILILVSIGLMHFAHNAPDDARVDEYLQRDLKEYCESRMGRPVAVHYAFLREGPTQSGIAYPKYYVWVEIVSNGKRIGQGAVRVAAIKQERFAVTDYFDQETIRRSPEALDRVFPHSVAEAARARAGP